MKLLRIQNLIIRDDFLDHDLFSQLGLKEMYENQFEEIVCWHQGSKSCLSIQQTFFQKHWKNSSLSFTLIPSPQKSKLAIPALSGSVWVIRNYNLKLSVAWQKRIVLQDFLSSCTSQLLLL